jgi:hypothetical protein
MHVYCSLLALRQPALCLGSRCVWPRVFLPILAALVVCLKDAVVMQFLWVGSPILLHISRRFRTAICAGFIQSLKIDLA